MQRGARHSGSLLSAPFHSVNWPQSPVEETRYKIILMISEVAYRNFRGEFEGSCKFREPQLVKETEIQETEIVT